MKIEGSSNTSNFWYVTRDSVNVNIKQAMNRIRYYKKRLALKEIDEKLEEESIVKQYIEQEWILIRKFMKIRRIMHKENVKRWNKKLNKKYNYLFTEED